MDGFDLIWFDSLSAPWIQSQEGDCATTVVMVTIWFPLELCSIVFACFCHGEFVSHTAFATRNQMSHVCLGMRCFLSTHVSSTHHTGWIHELLKGYNLMSCMFACTSELLSGKVLLLCCALYLYRPTVIDSDLDNRHDLELMLWLFWSALFADAFYWRKDWCCYMSVSDQKSCWLGCLCRAEGEDNCWSMSWACAKHHCTDVLHILW